MRTHLMPLTGSPLVGLAFALLAASCAEPDRPECESGSRSCLCGPGLQGVEVCENQRYRACECPLTIGDAGADASDADAGWDAGSFPERPEDGGLESEPDAGNDSCGEQTSEATLREERSVDVIFIIDNSGSMSDEIAAIESNINTNFARILDARGADYRLIVLASHGSNQSQHICVQAPLSQTNCSPIPTAPQNGERFFQYDRDVQSTDSWCRLLETFDTPDVHGYAPTGWQAWLRPGSLKVFVEFTDDGVGCSTTRGNFYVMGSDDPAADAVALAGAFNSALLTLSPEHFGTPSKPNYIWHSVIGIRPSDPVDLPWPPNAPLQTATCKSAYNAGAPYQQLSIGTGGLRYPVCEGQGFSSVFRAIAAEVVKGSGVECRFAIPEPPPGKRVDPASISIEYTAGHGGAQEGLVRVDPRDCNDRGFVVDGSEILLCDAACTRVRADEAAKLRMHYGCSDDGPVF